MYDTIHIWLSRASAGNVDLLAETPYFLQNVGTHQKDGQLSYTGNLENLKICFFESGVSIKGSWAKYYLNDNIQTLQRSDGNKVIEKLSDELHLPINKAKATRLDIAQNYIMDLAPESYYQYLGNCRYYKRSIYDHSLYYTNNSRTMVFYNKTIEVKKKGYVIPDVWQDSNVLRYEYRIYNRVSKRFKTFEVNAQDLFDEQFYINIIDEYYKEFENINKLNTLNFNAMNIKTPGDFWKQINIITVHNLGQMEIDNIVENMRKNHVFKNPESYSRIKRQAKELAKMPEISDSSELIAELNQKIKAVTSNYR